MGERSWLTADDAQVRSILESRLSQCRGARSHSVLGLAPGASAQDARAAFLEATKSYHPARFSRRPNDIQRLANQLFLVIKSAYEDLGGDRAPVTRAPASQPDPAPPAARPAASSPPVQGARGPRGGAGRAAAPGPGRAGHGPPASSSAPATAARATSNTAAGHASAGSSSPVSSAALMQNPQFREAVTFCDRGDYRAARMLLIALRRAFPDSPMLEAHLHYAWSGEWLERGRQQQALASLKRSLAADPDFEPAKKALAKAAASLLKR